MTLQGQPSEYEAEVESQSSDSAVKREALRFENDQFALCYAGNRHRIAECHINQRGRRIGGKRAA